jgi:hypothetical protein
LPRKEYVGACVPFLDEWVESAGRLPRVVIGKTSQGDAHLSTRLATAQLLFSNVDASGPRVPVIAPDLNEIIADAVRAAVP